MVNYPKIAMALALTCKPILICTHFHSPGKANLLQHLHLPKKKKKQRLYYNHNKHLD